jgi:hypothetical protein
VHAQKQAGLNWIGVRVAGRQAHAEQMRGIAKIARDFGDGDIRLTVWQNLLISGVHGRGCHHAVAALDALGISTKATAIRAGLVACTGSMRLPFLAASDTKRHAEEIAALLRGARSSSTAGEHPPDRLPSLLRPALYRRHRLDRRARRDVGRRRHGRRLSHPVGGGFGPEAASAAKSTAT